MRQYVLNGETKNPLWVLRQNNVYVPDNDKGERQIMYIKGAPSIYVDEISDELKERNKRKKDAIEFKEGKLSVPDRDWET